MKKYIKPSINVINLKSSENIAATFKSIREGLVQDALYEYNNKNYTVSMYSLNTSALETVVE